MNKYTADENVLILLSLLKAHGIKKVVASPGVANINLVASMQYDSYFEMYSAVDERSAAYIACGLAIESGQPVVITCTGATASRNYMSALTEAYYNKLPILAITSTKDISRIGDNLPQLIDRRNIPNDIAKFSINVPLLHTEQEEYDYTILMNKAILELKRDGGGPVHINMTSSYSRNFTVDKLPNVKILDRLRLGEDMPDIPKGKVGIFVGAHSVWNARQIRAVEEFCSKYNAVVFTDQISNYKGKYSVFPNILTFQRSYFTECFNMNLMIYIGNIYGTDFQSFNYKEVWRVNPDGEVRDTFGSLTFTFDMEEVEFFEYYNKLKHTTTENVYLNSWIKEINECLNLLPELPFSNIWIAQQTINKLPLNASIHFGIQNSLRCWNFFRSAREITGYSNTGGFVIDGCVSTLVGASLVNKNKLYFGIVGDLAFFYDMNALCNRHIGNNIRLMVVNNGRGQQFRNPFTPGGMFGKSADDFIAAAGHNGNKSFDLLRHFATDLGFLYLSARNKEEYIKVLDLFVDSKIGNKSIILEVFTETDDESEAMRIIKTLKNSSQLQIKNEVKTTVKKILGKNTINKLKSIIGK